MWVSSYELEGILGKDMARVLTETRGGVKFYVPQEASRAHWLAKVVGVAGMVAMCETWPGAEITVPNGRREPRKAEVLRLLAQGMPKAKIAERCDVTERYVYMVAEATGPKQLPLPMGLMMPVGGV